ncbi:hypothetical protein [Maridesulfovibrio ferrireducens]|uniref:hypothetical protein n=1 Tax=Maridesulfovibrio ferrireducens TaxID=246191 RepID=UPI001A31EC7A|nr:hypothetical protein [Maridesulfovibrio ferrireducens]MBI9112386.1 hypothetical protein [Maridesulfovibrio ferrireducens]
MTAQTGSGDGTVAGVGANTGQGVGAVDVTITFAALNASTGIYGKAQPDKPTNYHTYAAGLVGITGAYGFGLQDRAGATLMNFNRIAQPNGYLEIGIDTENHAVIGASPSQKSGVTVTVNKFASKDMDASELKTTYSVNDFTTYATICSFNASINVNGWYGFFMLNSNSLPTGSPTALQLIKLYESNGTSAFFGNYAATGPIYSDGAWWLTDLSGNHILPSDRIITGNHYYAHFVVKNNGKYDENPALGQITAPIALGTDTSSSGCVLNSEANFTFELAGLFLAALILAGFRKKTTSEKLK